MQILEGGKGAYVPGLGGCGGTNVDAPAWTDETVWEHYYLCTNVTNTQPISTGGIGGVGPTLTENSAWCGNFEFATECPDVIDAANLDPPDDCQDGDGRCLNCHEIGSNASVGGSYIGMDYLHAMKSVQPDPFPYPCDGSDSGPVSFSAHVQPIIDNNCSCHKWMYPDVSYGNLVNAPSGQPSLFKVKPFEPENRYLWPKLNNTFTTAPAYACPPGKTCCAMPKDCSSDPTPLADWQLDTIREWIEAGAPNN